MKKPGPAKKPVKHEPAVTATPKLSHPAPVVEIAADVQQQIRRHARTSMEAEICGVLIGNIRDGATVIANTIEGQGARTAGTHVTFTQETWAHVYEVKDSQYPDDRIVGWYHSHPGFGVFLSEHDIFIHKNFFSDPNQVAWVFDPHSDEEGCFVWKDGEIVRLQSLEVRGLGSHGVESPHTRQEEYREEPSRDPDWNTGGEAPAPRSKLSKVLKWTFLALSYVFVLVLGFFAGGFFLSRVVYVPVDRSNPYGQSDPFTLPPSEPDTTTTPPKAGTPKDSKAPPKDNAPKTKPAPAPAPAKTPVTPQKAAPATPQAGKEN